MIPEVVGVHLLLSGVDFGIAMDDHMPGGLFRKIFRIDVGYMFQKDDRDIQGAFPGVALGVFQIYGRNGAVEESFFPVIHTFNCSRKRSK